MILSAGHCVKQSWLIRMLPMDAVAGTHDVNNYDASAQIIKIARRISHPQYLGDIGPYDIGMLRTSTPFKLTNQIQPIQLPVDSDLRRQALTLTGWGALKTTTFIPDLPSKLQEVQVTSIPYDDCYQALEDLKEVGEDNPLDKNAHICTGPLSGGVAACNGDSGGPLIAYISYSDQETSDDATEGSFDTDDDNNNDVNHKNENGGEGKKIMVKEDNSDKRIPIVLGVVSWGIAPCGEKGAPTVYTNVSSYLDFIYEHIYE